MNDESIEGTEYVLLTDQTYPDGPVVPRAVPTLTFGGSPALTNRLRPQLRDEALRFNARHLTLISGGPDQSPTATAATLSTDTTNFSVGDRGTLVTIASATTATVIYDPVNPGRDDPMVVRPVNAVGLSVFVTNASQITTLTLELYGDSGLTAGARWSRSAAQSQSGGLVNGWNHLRWRASEGTLTPFTAGIWRARIVAVTNAATTFTVGHAWLECRDKASIIFVNDSCYESFLNEIYPDFKARRWPVTWAPDPAALGTNTGVNRRMTEAQLAAVMADGNGNECSFHGWDGAATELMTADEYRTDVLRGVRWLRERGYFSGSIWKAAVTQNLANNGAAANSYLWASATYANNTGTAANAWPPTNRYNLIRFAMHNQTTTAIDTAMTALQATNGVGIWYTHGVEVGGVTNMDPTLWAYIRNAWDTAIAAGWLELVTLSELLARRGGRVIEAGGRTVVEWVDIAGTTQRQVLA